MYVRGTHSGYICLNMRNFKPNTMAAITFAPSTIGTSDIVFFMGSLESCQHTLIQVSPRLAVGVSDLFQLSSHQHPCKGTSSLSSNIGIPKFLNYHLRG